MQTDCTPQQPRWLLAPCSKLAKPFSSRLHLSGSFSDLADRLSPVARPRLRPEDSEASAHHRASRLERP
eukprot:1634788-Rhodomonas_salina.2